MDDGPIFRSAHQALYVAFWIEQHSLTQKGSTQILIEDLKRRHFCLDDVPHHERNINVSGLTPLEMRGQCASIRHMVERDLPEPERDAIWARFAYQCVKAEGVRGVAEYVTPLCATRNALALFAVCWAIYKPRPGDWSLRALEREFGVSKSTLGRDQAMARKMADSLEQRGQSRLGDLFERKGLIGEPERMVAS